MSTVLLLIPDIFRLFAGSWPCFTFDSNPFSLLMLIRPSRAQAQSNLTELNIDVWGTCNTDVDADQCAANMGWFESQLQTACSQETRENNQMVLQALAGAFLPSLVIV
jgi:hypothetical protein